MVEVIEPGIPKPRKVKWIIAGVCLLLIVVAGLAARPVWLAIKEWRATQLAEEAVSYMEDDSFELAWEKAQSAYALYPDNELVARTVAKVTMVADPALAVEYWEQAYAVSGKREDLEQLIESAILGRNLIDAETYLETLRALNPKSGQMLLLEAKLQLTRQDIPAATEAARKAVKAADVPEEAHFLYVQLTQFSEDPEVRKAGIDYLRDLTQQPNEQGLKALRNLGEYSANTPDELKEVIARIRAHPKSERADLLMALKLEMKLPDANAQKNLEAAMKVVNVESPEQLIELGRWLNQQGRFVQTLEIISPEKARERRDLFLIWLDALAVSDQWDVIDQALADSSTPIDNYLRLLFQARVYLETGQEARAEFAWSRAVLEVANDPRKLWFLTYYARRLNLYEESKEVLDRLTELPTSRRKAYEELVALEQREGSVRELRDRLEEMHEDYPKDTSVQNDLAYANLLLDENIKESLQSAQQLIADGSPYLANRVTLALAYYKQGRALDAADILDPLPVDWSQARSGWRAVYIAVLRANGRIAEANELLAGIDVQSLLTEERLLLGGHEG